MNWLRYGCIGLAGWLGAAEAQANSCLAGIDVALPSGQADVPANTKVWIGDGYFSGDLTLLDADGNEVPTTQTQIGQLDSEYSVTVLSPTEDLALGDYRVVATEGETQVSAFTVSAAADTTPPSIPAGIAQEQPSDRCVGLTVDADVSGDALILARVNGSGMLDPDAPSGTVNDLSQHGNVTIGDCGCARTWLDASPGKEFEIEFAAFDAAGNFSGWSEPDASMIADEDESGCGCNASPRPSAAILLLLLLALRRRRCD